MATPDYPLAKEHYLAFGAITHMFARNERLIERAIAAIAKTHPGWMALVTVGLPYSGKKDAFLSMLPYMKLSKVKRENLAGFVERLHTHAGLRNSIAHSVWQKGRKPGSVKPVGISVRGGRAKLRGLVHNEPEYTVEQLQKIADELTILHNSFRDYLKVLRLWK